MENICEKEKLIEPLNTNGNNSSYNDNNSEQKSLMTKKKGKVKSDAYPKDSFGNNIKIPEYAKIHKLLINKNIDELMKTINYSDLKRDDYIELANLHREWFPLKYSKSFYSGVLNCDDLEDLEFLDCEKEKNKSNSNSNQYTISIGVYVKIEDKNSLIGCITAEITSENYFKYMFNCEIENKNDIYNIPFYDYNHQFCYIMTIGVIDEFRKKGISKILINKLIDKAKQKTNNCKGLFLHVIEHNTTAIKFYESLGFNKGRTFHNYYNINSAIYNALGYYKIFDYENKDNYGFINKIFTFLLGNIVYLLLLFVYFLTFGNFYLCRKCNQRKFIKVN